MRLAECLIIEKQYHRASHLLKSYNLDTSNLRGCYLAAKAAYEAKELEALCILNNEQALDISQLSSLIKDSSFVIANDTGPAHIAAHVGVKGLTLFGKHTTAYKVSIERENFKAIEVTDLNKLSAEKVFERLSNSLS